MDAAQHLSGEQRMAQEGAQQRAVGQRLAPRREAGGQDRAGSSRTSIATPSRSPGGISRKW